jgi:hypothetical protein
MTFGDELLKAVVRRRSIAAFPWVCQQLKNIVRGLVQLFNRLNEVSEVTTEEIID